MGNPMAPALPELTPRGEVALLARILYREGYDDHLAGHITLKLDDDSLLVNPFGMWLGRRSSRAAARIVWRAKPAMAAASAPLPQTSPTTVAHVP